MVLRNSDKWIREEYADFPEMLRLMDENREEIRQRGRRGRLWLWLHDRGVRVRFLEQPVLPRLRALPRLTLRGAGVMVGWILMLVVTWGLAFRLAYRYYGGNWGVFWGIVVAWLAVCIGILSWLFGGQIDPECAAERKAFWERVEAIHQDTSRDVADRQAAVEALMPSEPKVRMVSRWDKFWAKVAPWRGGAKM